MFWRSARSSVSTFAPVADTEINADRPTINFGRASGLGVDASPERIGLLRFTISIPPDETVTKATLRLFSPSQHPTSYFVHPIASTTWGETTTTYVNAPAIGQQGIASGPHPGNAYVSVDVTALVDGPGATSFAVKRTSDVGIPYNSREAATNRPELVIERAARSDSTLVFAVGDGADQDYCSGVGTGRSRGAFAMRVSLSDNRKYSASEYRMRLRYPGCSAKPKNGSGGLMTPYSRRR